MTISRGASAGRALHIRRWSQERRQCARSVLVKTFSSGVFASDGGGGEELSRQVVWLRTTLSQVRRRPQRGQSRQSTGAEASGALVVSVGEASGGEEESGHNTALTRRGFSVVLLS